MNAELAALGVQMAALAAAFRSLDDSLARQRVELQAVLQAILRLLPKEAPP